MKSRLTNAILGLMNFLFGGLIVFYSFYMPELNRATENETIVVNELYKYIFILMIVVLIINLIAIFFNRRDKILLLAYAVSIISSSFYFFDIKLIAILYILSALLIEIQVLRENVIVQSNTFFLILVSIVIVSIGIVGINCLTYRDKVNKLDKIQNQDKIEYDENFFKYVTELDDKDLYINAQKNGKWGYINLNGNQKIDYKYDYASPFVKINKFNKKFDVALVCSGDISYLILKNERVVFSYKNDISIYDYNAQLEKLKSIYIDVLKQDDFESNLIVPVTENLNKIEAYEGKPYRYPFNSEYDILITVSQSGTKNRYEFIKKGSDTIKVSIDCDNLAFDDKYLYLYSNGYLPFYKTSEDIQGWYTKDTKRVEIEGNVQILDFFGDLVLVKNYDENNYYFIDSDKKIISSKYLDIYVAQNAYIVKNQNGYYEVIDNNFKTIMALGDSNFVDTTFLNYGILVCTNVSENIEFNDQGYPLNINYKLINVNNGATIGEGYTNLYNLIFVKENSIDEFIRKITDIKYSFFGEKYYEGVR